MRKIIYLIRHSKKEKVYGDYESDDSNQIKNEKRILSVEGEILALKLSQLEELKDIEEIWCSNYVRTIQTAKYIADNNKIKINISSNFDERHYGDREQNINEEEFWINQYKDEKLKNPNGECQVEVRNRMDEKINDLLDKSEKNKIAIVTHNTCTLFYLLKYCRLDNAQIPKKITISYKNKNLIKNGTMKSPSIMKLEFEDRNLQNIEYIEILGNKD